MPKTFPLLASALSVATAALPAAAQQAPAPSKPAPAVKPAAKPTSKPAATAIKAAPPAAPAPKLPKNVVARVNNTDVTSDQLVALLQRWNGRPLVQQMIQATVIEQEAKKLGVSVSATEVADEVKKQKNTAVSGNAQNTGSMMTWQQIAARDGLSDGFVEWTVRLNLLAKKTFQKVVAQGAPGLDNQIKLAHILIPTMDLTPTAEPKASTPEEEKKREEEAKAKAEQILADIKGAKITFEEAAKQFSADKGPDGQGGSAAQGGALPWYAKGMLDPAFESAGWALAKPGDMTEAPVKSQFGYHIIKLVQKGKDAPAAEKAAYKQQMVDRMMSQPNAMQGWVQSLVQGAKVTFNPAPAIAGSAARSAAVPTANPATKPAAVRTSSSKPAPAGKQN